MYQATDPQVHSYPAASKIAQVDRLAASMSSDELLATWEALAERARERWTEGTIEGGKLIDLAAGLAACHPGLQGRAREVRSWLAVEAGWRDLVEKIAGEPRRVLDFNQAADSALKQARIVGEAISAIWNEPLLPSSEVARLLGANASNREKVNALRRRSRLLGLPRDGGRRYLYPAFQVDVARQRLFPEVGEVNELLGAAEDPWGTASWWLSENDRLGGRPMDLVGTEQAPAVAQAARSLLQPLG